MKQILPCQTKLPRAVTPESVGVDSNVILEYVKEVEKRGFRFDSLMVFRNGKVASEFYWKPYSPEYTHDMYSFSKTVTATAVGLAIDEGLLTLDKKVYDFFPEKYAALSPSQKKRADKMTIHTLLSMRSGKKPNMFNNTEKMNWTENYMNTKIKKEPETKWEYVSENIYMLAKIVTIVSGRSVVEFMTPRLFEPLEMGVPEWEGDHDGVEAGGWGLRMSTEQMAKFTLLYLQNGKWNGKQILSENWMKLCQSKQVASVPCIIHDGTYYGYQTWLNTNPVTSTRFDGLFGQISVIFPEQNAFMLFNAHDTREYEYIKMIFDYFPRAFVDGISEKTPAEVEKFKAEQSRKTYDYLPASQRNPKIEKLISGKKITVKCPKANNSILGISSYFMWSKKPGKAEYFKFDFSGDVPTMSWKEKNSPENTVKIGMDGEFAVTDANFADVIISVGVQGEWKGDKLILNIHPIGMTQNRTMEFTFSGNNVKIKSDANLHIGNLLVFYMYFSGINAGVLANIIYKFVPLANAVLFDPNMKGIME